MPSPATIASFTDDHLLLMDQTVAVAPALTWTPLSLTDLAAWYEPDMASDVRSQVAMAADTNSGGVFATTLVTDSFNRADGALRDTETDGPSGVDALTWGAASTGTGVEIFGNQCRSGASGQGIAGVSLTRDVVVEATVVTLMGGNLKLMARTSGVGFTDQIGIYSVWEPNGTTKIRITNTDRVLGPNVPVTPNARLRFAVWGDRARFWINDVLIIDYTLSANDLAILGSDVSGGFSLTAAEGEEVIDNFSVRTVDPATDFAEDASAPGDVGLTDVDGSITADSLYVSAVDGSGTDGVSATRTGGNIVIAAASGTIATTSDPGTTGQPLRVIRKGTGVWAYSNGLPAGSPTLSAGDNTAASGGFTDGTEAGAAPSVSVLPDLSGQHRHATQTEDGTAGAYLSGEGLSLTGVDGNFGSTPDAAALSIVGDLSGAVRATLPDYTPAAAMSLLAKSEDTSDQRAYRFWLDTDGTINLTWSTDGTAAAASTATSTAATGLTDGDTVWLGWSIDVDNGAADADVKFWTGTTDDDDPTAVTWAQLGTTVNPGSTTSISDTTALLVVGSDQDDGTGATSDGLYRRATVYNSASFSTSGPGGTAQFDADFTGKRGATSFVEDSANAATVTVNSTATDRRPLLLPNITDGGTGSLEFGATPAGQNLTTTGTASWVSGSQTDAGVMQRIGSTLPVLWHRNTSAGSAMVQGEGNNQIYTYRPATSALQTAALTTSIDYVLVALHDGATDARLRADGVEVSGALGPPVSNTSMMIGHRHDLHSGSDADHRIAAHIVTDADETANLAAIELHLSRHTTWEPT